MPRSTVTMYCHDPACEGAHGVTVGIHPATWTEPADFDRDDCEHCGQLLHGEALPQCLTCDGDAELWDPAIGYECDCPACDGTGFAKEATAA